MSNWVDAKGLPSALIDFAFTFTLHHKHKHKIFNGALSQQKWQMDSSAEPGREIIPLQPPLFPVSIFCLGTLLIVKGTFPSNFRSANCQLCPRWYFRAFGTSAPLRIFGEIFNKFFSQIFVKIFFYNLQKLKIIFTIFCVFFVKYLIDFSAKFC